MTIRNRNNHNYELGNKIRELRERLSDINGGMQGFIDYASDNLFGGEEWISLKTLSNYELGKNVPNLSNAKKLSVALQMDLSDFIAEIEDYID